MALILANAVANSLLGYVFGNTTPAGAGAVPATYYVGLFTANPTGAGGGTEVTGGGYARQALTNNTTNFPAPTTQEVANGAAITFPTATAAYPAPVTSIGFWDALTAGNFKFAITLPTPVTVSSGQTFSISTGFLRAQAYGE